MTTDTIVADSIADTCTISRGHSYTTFDGLWFTYHAPCTYNLASSCSEHDTVPPFQVFSRIDHSTDNAAWSLTDYVEIHSFGGDVVRFARATSGVMSYASARITVTHSGPIASQPLRAVFAIEVQSCRRSVKAWFKPIVFLNVVGEHGPYIGLHVCIQVHTCINTCMNHRHVAKNPHTCMERQVAKFIIQV